MLNVVKCEQLDTLQRCEQFFQVDNMPRTRAVAGIAEQEIDEVAAGSENNADVTVVDRLEELERRLAEEEENHQREMDLRERLIAMKLRHRAELEALEEKCSEAIKRSNSTADDDGDDACQERGQPYSFRDIEEGIEEYNGTASVNAWLSDFEATAIMARWTDRQKLIMCRKKMTGAAKAFLWTLRVGISYQQLKEELTKEFGEIVRASDIHRQLTTRRRKIEESALDYVYAMQRIAQPLQLDEQSFCEYVADGYTCDEKLRVILYEAQTIASLKEKLVCIERAHNKRSVIRGAEGGKRKNCFNCGSGEHQLAHCPIKNSGPKCFQCNAYGHRAKQCTKQTPGKDTKCFKCGEIGHISRHCTNAAPKSAKVNFISNRYPTVGIKFGNVDVQAMVDTGSDVSLIRHDFCENLELSFRRKIKNSQQVVRGYGGQHSLVNGELGCEVVIGNKKTLAKFLVVPKAAIDSPVLIGIDTLEQLSYKITNGHVEIMEDVETNNEKKSGEEQSNEDYRWVLRIVCDDQQELDAPPGYRRVLSEIVNNYEPSTTSNVESEMKIRVNSQDVVRTVPRRLAPLEKEVVKKQVREWLKDGIIQQSQSPYASAVVVVPKKDGSRRVCVDYREINKMIVRDSYPMPNIEEQIDQLADARVYSVLDLKNSYFHVKVEEASRQYTSFVTTDGQYEFLRAPFGLCISGNAFGRFISAALQELIMDGTVMAFVDDVIVPSKDEESGLLSLRRVLEVAQRAGLRFNWKKCVFLRRRVEYLGYTIYNGQIEPSPQKIEKVKHFPLPKTAKQLQRFIGLASYFRKFIEGFASMARPLTTMLKKESNFEFDNGAIAAFKLIKESLVKYPVLHIFNEKLETELHTDASKAAIAGILLQRAEEDGKLHPCYYYSRLTDKAEKNYHSFELETLAVVEAMKKFRCYLLGKKFKLVTDCLAFKQSLNKKIPNARISRWFVTLSEFDFIVEHRAGDKMRHVDALSRATIMVISAVASNRILEAQKNDETACEIVRKIEKGESVDDFVMKNGILYRGIEGEQLYVPQQMQEELIRNAHARGHFGVRKTKERLTGEYYIANLDDKIKKCIENCVTCIVSEKKKGKLEGQLRPIPKGDVPLDTFHVDHLGPMPSTRKSYNYILTVVDAFTKFIWLFPTKTTNAEEVVNKLTLLADTFGDPRRIICDRGAAFTSGHFEKYCLERGIELHKIVTGVPRGNGQVERIHRIIIPVLTKLAAGKPEEWFKYVNKVQLNVNNSWQRAIRMTPLELLIGTKMKCKDDLELAQIVQEEMQQRFVEERNTLRERARGNIQKMQEENRKEYNLRRRPETEYAAGSIVAIPVTQFVVGGKVKPRYNGPYEVVKKLPNNRYEVRKIIQDSEGPRNTTTSGDVLKMWARLEQA